MEMATQMLKANGYARYEKTKKKQQNIVFLFLMYIFADKAI